MIKKKKIKWRPIRKKNTNCSTWINSGGYSGHFFILICDWHISPWAATLKLALSPNGIFSKNSSQKFIELREESFFLSFSSLIGIINYWQRESLLHPLLRPNFLYKSFFFSPRKNKKKRKLFCPPVESVLIL